MTRYVIDARTLLHLMADDALVTIDQALAAKAAHVVPLATVAALSED